MGGGKLTNKERAEKEPDKSPNVDADLVESKKRCHNGVMEASYYREYRQKNLKRRRQLERESAQRRYPAIKKTSKTQ